MGLLLRHTAAKSLLLGLKMCCLCWPMWDPGPCKRDCPLAVVLTHCEGTQTPNCRGFNARVAMPVVTTRNANLPTSQLLKNVQSVGHWVCTVFFFCGGGCWVSAQPHPNRNKGGEKKAECTCPMASPSLPTIPTKQKTRKTASGVNGRTVQQICEQ